MAELPTGTVTLLFTDIEGSTKLLKALGDEYDRVLSDHRGLLRRAFNLFGGHVVDRQGDAFFVVFRRAKDAVSAAVELQRSLSTHPWPESSKVLVRVGIHTGEPSVGEEGLTGFAVHVASRICGVANGGQIVISHTTHDLVEDQLPPRTHLRDLDEHTLKDIDRPARLFQVVVEDLDERSEPLRIRNGGAESGQPPSPESDSLAAPVPRRSESLRDWTFRSPSLLRAAVRRRLGRTSTDHLGAQIHSMARLSPSPELAAALRALGGGILQSGREDRSADEALKSIDRRELERRLRGLRNASFLTEENAQLADQLAARLAAVERLAIVRREFRAEARRIEERTENMREQVFAARLGGSLPNGLVEEIDAFSDDIRSLGSQLQQARHDAFDPIR